MSVLKAVNLGKKYSGAENRAVIDFSFEVEQGEIIALLGESGCGKTTVLRMISGFEIPDSGELYLNDKQVSGKGVFVEPENRGVGIVFQDHTLFPHKRVWENIGFGLFRLAKREQSERVREVMQLTGLQGFEERYPHQLSGGQQQRVALARALAPRPELILFDEPFSNLDSVLKNQMREEIRNILKMLGTTAIFVTHDTNDVLAIADRAVVLKEGRTLQTGRPEAIYVAPATRYVASFFGKTNFIKAKAVQGGFETAAGFVAYNHDSFQHAGELTLSIRPGSFIIAGEGDEGAIRAKILNEKFFGEYRELLIEVSGTPAPETLTIHVGLQHQFKDTECWFRIDNDRLGVISNPIE
ncbi:MAG: ABC transporter ATP-binding protein [Bacteroidales bacterium]